MKKVKIKSILTTGLIIATTFVYCYFQNPVSARMIDKPDMTTYSEPENEATGISKIKTDNINAVILGDSISVSQGASDIGWNMMLGASLKERYKGDIHWINKGMSGTTIDYCLKRSNEITSDVDVVFVCVGRNDRNVFAPEEFGDKYAQLIANIKKLSPTADIFLIIEPPMVSADDSKFNNIRQEILNVAIKTKTKSIDVWSTFPQDQTRLGYLLADGLHPNDDGYKIMSNYLLNYLNYSIMGSKIFYCSNG